MSEINDFDGPNYRVATETTAPSGDSGGGKTTWLWIVLFLIALAAIIGLGVWVAYLYHERSKEKGKTIDFKDPVIEVVSDTSIKGSWQTTNDPNDVITLYATTEPPEFDNNGNLTNPASQIQKQQAATNTTSVTLAGLQRRLKYYATLVATNTQTSNYQVYTQLVYMASETPVRVTVNSATNLVNNTFSIQDILQVGKLEAAEITAGSTGPYQVQFNQAPSEARSLWYVNTNGQIQLDETGTGVDNVCLFRSGETLVANNCGTTGSINLTDSAWTYKNNKWCLQSTTSNDSPACMVLNDISSSTGKATVSVTTTSKPGDAWVNAFENPV